MFWRLINELKLNTLENGNLYIVVAKTLPKNETSRVEYTRTQHPLCALQPTENTRLYTVKEVQLMA